MSNYSLHFSFLFLMYSDKIEFEFLKNIMDWFESLILYMLTTIPNLEMHYNSPNFQQSMVTLV